MSFFSKNDPQLTNTDAIILRQRQLLEQWKEDDFKHLFAVDRDLATANQHNCENMIGAISVPVGLAGPIMIHDLERSVSQEYFVPLATTEGALVASVGRGLKAIGQVQGANVWVEHVGMTRAPVFAFADGQAARKFIQFLQTAETQQKIATVTETTSKHLRFKQVQTFIRGRQVYARFVFDTQEAMGMNMVTIALQHLWDEFLSTYEGIEMVTLSSNVCTDKKTSYINQLFGRGLSAQAEVFLSDAVINSTLKTTRVAILATHQSKNVLGSNLAGSPSSQMQFANVVAAFYLATGQDMAHVVEASQGTTIIEPTEDGVYVAVSLPDLPLGTVGGGLNLPAQTEVRKLLTAATSPISVVDLAKVLSTGVLAAEISGLAALSNHTLAGAHQRLARPTTNTAK